MINYIHSTSPASGAESLSKMITTELENQKKVLWLVCGGSNIPTAVEVMDTLQQGLSVAEIGGLTVMQTDERYGPVGHPDSNWQQLMDLNFNIVGIRHFPILRNLSLKETVEEFAKVAESAFKEADIIIGQFGIGKDGHIAGILPHSLATSADFLTKKSPAVCGYETDSFTRVTLTFPMLERINVAYVFASGESKREAINNLKNKELSFDDEPAQVLKKINEVYFYSDIEEKSQG